ncbi:MAG: tRNA preQ1(34) S-adenosylmethionine ribosyltransferase-isomerase QueA [Candidatus Polarisedimenticolaceae bacterium]|nr:tRNA preQ1(34) S-adenosylmethionine ribosyltransferase-isomerase QueA [Candidatus Polarisedimenticolaceae bacterium]
MNLADFRYDLPQALIAQYPLENRSDSRLLVLEGASASIDDLCFKELPKLLNSNDLLVFNNTRVMAARLFGHKESGGKIEVLVERVLEQQRMLAHIRASKSPKAGSRIILGDQVVDVIGRKGELFELSVQQGTPMVLMEQHGHMPLPPYIDRSDESLDLERYQTLFSEHSGAVAAPTAGLHFDQELLQQVEEMGIESVYVTLHVGAGTFQPVRVENIDQHVMHSEQVEVSAAVCEAVRRTRQRGGRVIAIGTTSVRSLEAASVNGQIEPFQGDTQIFIRTGYTFRSVDAMVTNIHLPESTLLMLVSAFAGYAPIMAAYHHAVAKRYRFFSYGDAMFLTLNP